MPYQIVNWKKYQGRKNRGTNPWVKVHKTLMGTDHLSGYSEKERFRHIGMMVGLLCLADDRTGKIDKTDEKICYGLRVKSINLEPYKDWFLKDLAGVPVDSQWIARGKPEACLSTSLSTSTSVVNKEKGKGFDEFWPKSPRFGSKKKAGDVWSRMEDEDRSRAMVAIVEQTEWRRAWEKHDRSYFIARWKDMERWLRDERFNDTLEWPPENQVVESNLEGLAL